MRLYSTLDSVRKNEVSLLAVVETIIAVALAFYFAAQLNTLKWLSVAICIAPLLLLRTDVSIRRTIAWLDAVGFYLHRTMMRFADSMNLVEPPHKGASQEGPFHELRYLVVLPIWLSLVMLLSLLYFTIVAFVIRFIATAATVLQSPILSLRAIPANWANAAREALLRMELGAPWPDGIVRSALGFTTSLRWLLTLYTIFCTGYVTLNAASGWNWPALGTKWLPWL